MSHGSSHSFHPGATLEATDKGIPPDAIEAIVHWKNSHQSGA
jgi:hypothetical protein